MSNTFALPSASTNATDSQVQHTVWMTLLRSKDKGVLRHTVVVWIQIAEKLLQCHDTTVPGTPLNATCDDIVTREALPKSGLQKMIMFRDLTAPNRTKKMPLRHLLQDLRPWHKTAPEDGQRKIVQILLDPRRRGRSSIKVAQSALLDPYRSNHPTCGIYKTVWSWICSTKTTTRVGKPKRKILSCLQKSVGSQARGSDPHNPLLDHCRSNHPTFGTYKTTLTWICWTKTTRLQRKESTPPAKCNVTNEEQPPEEKDPATSQPTKSTSAPTDTARMKQTSSLFEASNFDSPSGHG
jgi:hypothetical protein